MLPSRASHGLSGYAINNRDLTLYYQAVNSSYANQKRQGTRLYPFTALVHHVAPRVPYRQVKVVCVPGSALSRSSGSLASCAFSQRAALHYDALDDVSIHHHPRTIYTLHRTLSIPRIGTAFYHIHIFAYCNFWCRFPPRGRRGRS